MDPIAERIDAVRQRIVVAARRAGRPASEIRLVGVTKTHPPELIARALAGGLTDLGENRIQEAETKIAALANERSRITWHLIGHLQRNKARKAAELFDIIHSLDSLRLAQALDRHIAETEDRGLRIEDSESQPQDATRYPLSSIFYPRPVLLQVNVSGEDSKEGFPLAGWEERAAILDSFFADIERLLALPHLRVHGLMTIAPWGEDPEVARPAFRSTRRLRDLLARRFPDGTWDTLSMGMTDDFEVAIEEGATLVRVGRAIFGARPPQPPL